MHAPVLSISHLSRKTMEGLSTKCNVFGLFCIPYDHGVLVYHSDIQDVSVDRDVPVDLAMCLRWSMRHGYEWTRFDSDGSQVDTLPTYAWE